MGSFASLLYRFNTSSDSELQDPLRWLITRPLIGIIIGSITYVMIQAGFLSIARESSTIKIDESGFVWLTAFIAGFSDKFSEGLLKTLVGRLGGDKDSSLVTATPPTLGINLMELLQASATSVKQRFQGSSTPQHEPIVQSDPSLLKQGENEVTLESNGTPIKHNEPQDTNSNQ
jgi:hypothetical protein